MAAAQGALEGAAHLVGDALAVRPGEVRRRPHGAQVGRGLGRAQRGAGELPVRQDDAPAGELAGDVAYVIGADLVAEAPRAAVDHHGGHAAFEPHGAGRLLVVDLVHFLHLEEVVARAERAELVAAPALRALAHRARVGVGQHATLLAVIEVARRAQAAPDRPGGPVAQHPVQVARLEAHGTRGAHAARHLAEERVGQRLHVRSEFGAGEPRAHQPHAAADVVAHGARRDHAVLRIEGHHAPDRQAVAPVGVRHGDRGLEDARQGRRVAHLLTGAVREDLLEQRPVGEDHPGHAHRARARDQPAEVVEALEAGGGDGIHGGGSLRPGAGGFNWSERGWTFEPRDSAEGSCHAFLRADLWPVRAVRTRPSTTPLP